MKIKNVLPICLVLIGLVFGKVYGQKQALSMSVLGLVNQARTNPTQFLEKHREEILEGQPKFAKLLQNSKPLKAATWDIGLESMCRLHLDKGVLNPTYSGKNTICGFASGMQGEDDPIKAMAVLFSFYTNIMDPNCSYLGLAFDASSQNFWYCWGFRCDLEHMQYEFTGKIDSSMVDFASLNTGLSESYFSAPEQRMLLEINFVRAYPKVYAQIIAQNLEDQCNGNWGLDFEDFHAGIELIDELNSMLPVPILQPKECIYKAAKAHGDDCARRGFIDHTGSDGSQPWERIKGQCHDIEDGNENLQGGDFANPRVAVISLLIDGGISGRGHRYNMIDEKWRFVGCYLIQGKPMTRGTHFNWVQNFGQ